MLTQVQITNFKSIGEGLDGKPGVDIELKPLTFLVGPNGGGKSSILEAIAFASQEGSLTGRLIDTSDHRLLSQRLKNEQRPLGFRRFFHKLEESRTLAVTLYPETAGKREWDSCTLIAMATRGLTAEIDLRAIERHQEDDFAVFFTLNGKSTQQAREELASLRAKLREQVYLIAGTRGIVRNEQKAVVAGADWVGRSGENLVELLAVISRPEHTKTRAAISKTMVHLGMKDPWAGWKGELLLGGGYEDPDLKVVLDAGNASQGGRQALAVVTQVAWSAPGSLTMIEEPEISLHPEAQVEMCRFLAKHAAQGKQIIASTHSPFMLLALQYPVEEGLIKPDQIAVYEVERDKKTGTTKATPLKIGKDGVPKGGVPSFSRVEQRLLRDWLKTLPEA